MSSTSASEGLSHIPDFTHSETKRACSVRIKKFNSKLTDRYNSTQQCCLSSFAPNDFRCSLGASCSVETMLMLATYQAMQVGCS